MSGQSSPSKSANARPYTVPLPSFQGISWNVRLWPVLKYTDPMQLHVPHDDIRPLVAIHVGDRHTVGRPLGAGKPDRFSELASAAIKDDEVSLEAFIDYGQIRPTIAVKVAGRAPMRIQA
jgi:hypothetical protein